MKASSVHPRGYHASGYGPHSQDIHHAVQGSYLALCGVKDPSRYTLEKLSVSCPICRVNLDMTSLEPSEERLRRGLWTGNPSVNVPVGTRRRKVNLEDDPRAMPARRGGVTDVIRSALRRSCYRRAAPKPSKIKRAGASVTVARPEAGQ
jgi:hypothetical protein